jgi:glycerol-3-phosphate dehydrogenase
MSFGQASLDLRDRAAVFAALESQVFDVAVIGGGITGAGVARDAALRGLSVALVEQNDFASGTSSRSSKMIHGGLRYLAQGDLGLVHEAASERKIVKAIAPHLAREVLFAIPARSAASIAKLRAGLWTFERLGGVPRAKKHQLWSREELARREPAMETGDLAGAIAYPEYLTDDARLTLANVRSARAEGAAVASYARVSGFVFEGARVVALEVEETLPGAAPRKAVLKARAIVNAAGPWVDQIRAMETSEATPRLALAKGIHLVCRREDLPVNDVVVTPAAGGRTIFVVPKGEATYIGTTDTFYQTPQTWPQVTAGDAAYLLAAVRARFPRFAVAPDRITGVWCGTRPLVSEPGKSASDISRKDEVWTGPGGVLSIAGGKLTAYRRMAERVVDKLVHDHGFKARACDTADEPLPGGEADPAKLVVELKGEGLSEVQAQRLVGLYGSEARSVAHSEGGPNAAAEAARAVVHEGALTLEDYFVRRSARAWYDPDESALEPAAEAMAPLLGWSAADRAAQIDHCRAQKARDLAAVRAVGATAPIKAAG